ncbi:MAG: iron-sulfur cluster assembly accessory protein [candidate division Zixibacteria bacterium]|nr:iron-sulfur cluster assembly accessory protein [candidate division Zixibacteria bacterium]
MVETLQNTGVEPEGKILVTDTAVREIKKILGQQAPGTFLRIGVKGGGCSGLSYMMNLDTQTGELDRAFEFGGVKVVVDAKALVYLNGLTLDYTGDLLNGAFRFNNPQAKRSCGCGSSFSV